jgi:imidazoleglycerol-phosphate dehydratase
MAPGEQTGVRIRPDGSGNATVDTGLSILDHLLALLAGYGRFDLALEVAPGSADAQVAAAGRAVGEALAALLGGPDVRRHGEATIPADEALAHVALEASGRPLLVSNVDLSQARVAGLGTDLARRFLEELAEAGGLTLHVRLVEGRDTEHVLEGIFKSLGAALGQACGPRGGKE